MSNLGESRRRVSGHDTESSDSCAFVEGAALESYVLEALAKNRTYDEIARATGTSRGKVYSIAVANNARKHEARIRERAAERRRRQLEFLKEAVNATQTADVLDFMAGLPNDSVDMFLTSLPYNVGVKYGDAHGADSFAFHYYLGWTMMVLSEMQRSIKPGGVIFLQGGSTRDQNGNLYPIDILLYQHALAMGLTSQSRVIWEVPHGLTPRRTLASRTETALVLTKGDEPAVFNPTPGRHPQKDPGKRAFKGPNRGRLTGHPLGAWPTNIWRIPNVGHNHPERTGHPAQFPEALVRRAILHWTLPGQLVVDPFVGSGTTPAVCVRTGRAFSGCDLFYEDMRKRRLEQVAPDLVSELPGVSDEGIAVWAAEARPRHYPAGDQQALFVH